LELELEKRSNRYKDLQSDKLELEKKHSFYQERIKELEDEVKKVQRENYNEMPKGEGALLPESMKADMREKIK
jgi:hypothetical protein